MAERTLVAAVAIEGSPFVDVTIKDGPMQRTVTIKDATIAAQVAPKTPLRKQTVIDGLGRSVTTDVDEFDPTGVPTPNPSYDAGAAAAFAAACALIDAG